ncbi:hypothetical protein KSW27_12155 [Holdemanella biformis]|nr:hypothetical protein [Holdemanella biformis]
MLATFKKQRNGGGKGANNENKKRTERRYNTVKCNGASQSSLRKNRAINHRGDLKMNKNKRVTVRFTNSVYMCEKKALTDNDEYLFNVSKIRGIYDHLAQLEMEFETIKNEARLSEYDILGYEREFADIEEELKKIK